MQINKYYIQDIFLGKKVDRKVFLMAISGKYAMVRIKGCVPYVCKISDLTSIPTLNELRELLK